MTVLTVGRHDLQNAFAADVAGAHVAVGLADLLGGEVVDRRDRHGDVAAGERGRDFGPNVGGIGLFLSVGMNPEPVHRFLIDERVDPVGFHTEADRQRDVARSERVDKAVDAVGGQGL
jgi:hypothetical protein